MANHLASSQGFVEDLAKVSHVVLVTNLHFVVTRCLCASDVMNDGLTEESFLSGPCRVQFDCDYEHFFAFFFRLRSSRRLMRVASEGVVAGPEVNFFWSQSLSLVGLIQKDSGIR